MRTPRVLLVSLLVAGALVGILAVSLAPGHHVVRRDARAAVVERADSATARALAILRAWDQRRAAAWGRGDQAALAALYVPGSVAGRRDRAMLAAYRARGLRVRSMHRQVLAARVRASGARRIAVVVTDRLVDAVAVGHGIRTSLPDGRARTRLITVWRRHGSWLVAAVSARGGGQPAR